LLPIERKRERDGETLTLYIKIPNWESKEKKGRN